MKANKCMSHALKVLLFISLCNSLLENSLKNSHLFTASRLGKYPPLSPTLR